ncbi:MAG: ATP synthase subunit A [Candidatus Diapherotrites archaeon CG08_land_8_20_14_0_20_34_12]|nr:MAG: ATP synthase subunit A [Candidatus Diapherotrites archaeon CG08_land_8_20_14_0_20_34_12]
MEGEIGTIYRISGPVVVAKGLGAKMYDLVKVGNEELMGEVIQISGDKTTIQVYENTTGIKPGEPVKTTGQPLSAYLGPGLLQSIYDGIQRPLDVLKQKSGDFIARGITASGLDEKKQWDFKATAKKGDTVTGGDVLGTVQETLNTIHKILVPPATTGKIKEINSGKFTITDNIGMLEDGTSLKLAHRWPVRKPRPYKEKLRPTIPLVTGQRLLDTLFPLAKGGTACIPGPFGSGKTVIQHQLAKWSDAQIVIYIGCGERGNEMTEVLKEFPHLQDVKTGRPLMERTVLIANTSNMPVAAREASIYTGITIAEYYRDQGYDVSLMADSTSRWAEAMREISSRLEEMPGEEGYPAYLASRLAEFYERAGRIKCLGKEERLGSVTPIGAVSPPGGDFSEPVTQNTLKVTKVFWALDAKLAHRRHFPAINWLTSYSLYIDSLKQWYIDNVAKDWPEVRKETMYLLQREEELQEIVQLVGSDALPEKERLILETTRLIRQGFLQQNAFHPIDSFCSAQKQFKMLKTILDFYHMANDAVKENVPVETIVNIESLASLVKAGFIEEKEFDKKIKEIQDQMKKEFGKITAKGVKA